MAASSERYLAPSVSERIAAAIDEADGNEVFFLGRCDEEGRVVRVRVLARGTRQAVLAISSDASYGDVVVHNHPSGELGPSSADMRIAAGLADEGVGFLIVDNAASRVYAVVEPFRPDGGPRPLDAQAVAAVFAPDGVLARCLDGYEPRRSQAEMASAVVRAFNEDGVALLEAGTGTGKSLAYLVPAALWALSNRERVLVATGTITLQEQIVDKDLVVLREVLRALRPEEEFRVALVKGRSNYLCRRRLALACSEQTTLFPDDQAQMLSEIAEWAELTREGSRQDLPFSPPWELWDELAAEADSCGRLACPHYGACFLMTSRRAAAQAHILVANHHLFFADAALRVARGERKGSAVLPEFRRVVLDEAHKLEDAASSFFGGRVSRYGLRSLLGRLFRRRKERSSGLGLLRTAQLELKKRRPERSRAIAEELIPLLLAGVELLESTFESLYLWAGDSSAGPEGNARARGWQLRLTPPVLLRPGWAEVSEEALELARWLRRLAGQIGRVCDAIELLLEEQEDQLLDGLNLELKACRRRLDASAEDLSGFFEPPAEGEDPDGLVRWIEGYAPRGRGRRPRVELHLAPLQVRDVMAQAVFDALPSAILTSATLSTHGGERGFDYLVRRLGLDGQPPGRVRWAVLPSAFHYAEQARVGVALDLPDPGERSFVESCAPVVLDAVTQSQGSAFVLFTSFSMLRAMHERLAGALAQRGLIALRQGETTRTRLLDRFRSEPGSVLFGTDSFWEGVDVRGDALRQVIIVRLPFRVPTEPLLEARVEAIQEQGGNPFNELTLPQAVIRFRQGFGRLIRSRVDRGAVLVLDRRASTRRYGRTFLSALPVGTPVHVGTAREILARLGEFLRLEPSSLLARSASWERRNPRRSR